MSFRCFLAVFNCRKARQHRRFQRKTGLLSNRISSKPCMTMRNRENAMKLRQRRPSYFTIVIENTNNPVPSPVLRRASAKFGSNRLDNEISRQDGPFPPCSGGFAIPPLPSIRICNASKINLMDAMFSGKRDCASEFVCFCKPI